MAFYPARGEAETPRDFGVPFDTVTLRTSDGEQLRAWRMHARAPRGLIVYFHGNGENLSNWAPILARIVQRGYSVFAVDYRGYGMSTGHPTERGLHHDVEAAIAEAWPAAARGTLPIVYWGRSLGASMAAYGATIRKPNGVIVEAGFVNGRAVVRDSPVLTALAVFASYRFTVDEYLNRAQAPVLVLHGDLDSIVPYARGQELFESITAPKTFVTIRGGDHNDAVAPDADAYWSSIDRFVASLK